MNTEAERAKLERTAGILADQADRLVRGLGVDVSDAERSESGSAAFRSVADAYEQLALAQRESVAVVWERSTVDGRPAADLMERLWRVRGQLEALDQDTNPNGNEL